MVIAPDEMNARLNPYAAPRDSNSALTSAANNTFPGRAFVSNLFALIIAGTAILLCTLWVIGAIDSGRFGDVFLASLVVATIVLVAAARCYRNGARKTAVGLVVLVPLLIGAAILLALHDAGVLSLS